MIFRKKTLERMKTDYGPKFEFATENIKDSRLDECTITSNIVCVYTIIRQEDVRTISNPSDLSGVSNTGTKKI